MNNAVAKRNVSLPTREEIIADGDLTTAEKSNNLMVLMNQEPIEQWVKDHPFIKMEVDGKRVPYRYLPIARIEFLLRRIFVNYKIEVLKTGLLLNSVECTVRVHYLHPITNEWLFHDGVGCQELQTAKDTGALKLDMSNINKSAVQMALPIAKSIAIKDACDHFGKFFGGDLNRKDAINYDNFLVPSKGMEGVNESKEKIRLLKYLAECPNPTELESCKPLFEKHGLLEDLQKRLKEF